MFQIICSSVFLIMVLIAPGITDEHFPFVGEVVKESVNVRAGANTNFEKIDKLERGRQVVVVGRQYEWYKIQLPATTKSYIRADYLQINKGDDVAELIGDKVNVRALPNSDASSLGQLIRGVKVKVIELINGWYRIEPVAGVVGFVHQDFLSAQANQVPASMVLKPVEVQVVPPAKVVAPVSLAPLKIKGVVDFLSGAKGPVKYQLLVDGKPTYLLEEGPKIASFVKSTVELEGSLVADPKNEYAYPVIHITKIALVL